MNLKLTLGIAIILLGGSLISSAQMTAYANIYAEVVARSVSKNLQTLLSAKSLPPKKVVLSF